MLGGRRERWLHAVSDGGGELLGFSEPSLVQEYPGVGAFEQGVQELVVAGQRGGDGALGGEGGEVFLAHVHHEDGGEVVGLGKQAACGRTSRLGGQSAFTDQGGEHGGQGREAAGPVQASSVGDGSAQLRKRGGFPVVAAEVDTGQLRGGQERVADGQDAGALAVAVEPGAVVEQLGQRDVQGGRQPGEDGQAGLAPSLLDLGDHDLADAGQVREFFLGEGVLLALAAEPVAERAVVSHGRELPVAAGS